MAMETSNDPARTRVLVVDDDEIVLTALKEQLPRFGFHVVAVNNPLLALQQLQSAQFAVLLVDNEMPEMKGMDLLAKAAEMQPDATRLLLASGIRLSELSEAIRSGKIYRYLTKPWLSEELQVTVVNAADRFRLLRENDALQARNISLNQQLAQSGQSAETSAEGAEAATGGVPAFRMSGGGEDLAMDAFNKMLYTFHPNLGNTAIRAVAICQMLGEVLELDPKDVRNLTFAAHLHDVGLLSVDIGVVRRWLRDPAKCTDEELLLIKKHTIVGQEMLSFHEPFKEAAEIVRTHHEYWDGTGYPDKLKGETIPRLARLLAPVIFFCNKHTASVQVMTELEALADQMFDPDAVRALVKAIPITKMPQGEREILIIELKAGMMLARDINNTNGMKLLPRGRQISDGDINRIWGINRITPINPLCLVNC